MKIKPIASNMTELLLNDGTQVLFSYQTPVAVIKRDQCLQTIQTSKKWSVTTSKHINKWFSMYGFAVFAYEDQEYFDNLVKGV